MTRILIVTAALAFGALACGRAPKPAAPKAAHQVPAKSADNMNAGAGYNGGDPENINRDKTPNAVGGGPTDPWADDDKGSGTTGGVTK